MIRFPCSKCSLKLVFGLECAGSSTSCPGCGTSLTIPGSSTNGSPAWTGTGPTSPHLGRALVLGLGIFAFIHLLGLLFGKESFFYQILFERTWVTFAESVLFSWGAGLLLLKFKKVHHQQSALQLDVVPLQLGLLVTKDNVHPFIQHVDSLPAKFRDSLMLNRVRKALALIEEQRGSAEVAAMMAKQSDIDCARISSSYSVVKIFIVAIPILGFAGTMLGLSGAIGGFQQVMGAAKDAETLTKSMGTVTANLGNAFDTTLLALIYSVILSVPMSSLKKLEENALGNIDDYCNEVFLPRLKGEGLNLPPSLATKCGLPPETPSVHE